jgi:hypothetical protein
MGLGWPDPRDANSKNAESIRIARQRVRRELLAAKEALERKSEELQQQGEWFEVDLSSRCCRRRIRN